VIAARTGRARSRASRANASSPDDGPLRLVIDAQHREGLRLLLVVDADLRALRIRNNAYIQIDPQPPLGVRYTAAEFEKAFAERDRRPHRPSAIQSFSR